MKTVAIEWVHEIRCPICQQAWLSYAANENPYETGRMLEDMTACEHLRFTWMDGDPELIPWCGWNSSKFEEAYIQAFAEIDGKLQGKHKNEYLPLRIEVFGNIKTKEIDTILSDKSFKRFVVYGIKRNVEASSKPKKIVSKKRIKNKKK